MLSRVLGDEVKESQEQAAFEVVKLCVVVVWAKVVSLTIVMASSGAKRFPSSQFAIPHGISVTDVADISERMVSAPHKT